MLFASIVIQNDKFRCVMNRISCRWSKFAFTSMKIRLEFFPAQKQWAGLKITTMHKNCEHFSITWAWTSCLQVGSRSICSRWSIASCRPTDFTSYTFGYWHNGSFSFIIGPFQIPNGWDFLLFPMPLCGKSICNRVEKLKTLLTIGFTSFFIQINSISAI